MTVLLDRPQHQEQRVPLALELAMYLAAILVAVGAAFIVARFWAELGSIGQLGVGLGVAAAGYGAALAMARSAPDLLTRPTAIARVVGVAGVALSCGVLARWLGADAPETVALAVGPPVLALGLLDWRNCDRPIPFLVALAGSVTTAAGIGTMLEPTPRQAGVVIWLAAMALLAVALVGSVRPQALAAIVAVVGSNIGATAFGADQERAGVLVVLASLVLVIVLGVTMAARPVIAVALVLFAVTLPRAMAVYLHGVGAALGMLMVGVLALAAIVPRLIRSVRRPR